MAETAEPQTTEREQPFLRVTIEVRDSPWETAERAQDRLRECMVETLKVVRKWVDVRIEAAEKRTGEQAQRIKVE